MSRRLDMPIKPENAARYPKNWKSEIVPAIRARSGNRCECLGECGSCGPVASPGWEEHGGRCPAVNGQPHPLTGSKVVLTTGHLEQDEIEDCALDKLRHWCQRCHLRYDQAHHQRNARVTRFKKKGQEDLGL